MCLTGTLLGARLGVLDTHFCKFAYFIHFENSTLKTTESYAESAILPLASESLYFTHHFFFCQIKSNIVGITVTLTILRGEPMRESEMMESEMRKH